MTSMGYREAVYALKLADGDPDLAALAEYDSHADTLTLPQKVKTEYCQTADQITKAHGLTREAIARLVCDVIEKAG